ncbi:hypothetical protein HK101_008694 [Irineochytrium annulatum]|nr:hypothetical protein HK101_008694 [Irineochytrium annulatum]
MLADDGSVRLYDVPRPVIRGCHIASSEPPASLTRKRPNMTSIAEYPTVVRYRTRQLRLDCVLDSKRSCTTPLDEIPALGTLCEHLQKYDMEPILFDYPPAMVDARVEPVKWNGCAPDPEFCRHKKARLENKLHDDAPFSELKPAPMNAILQSADIQLTKYDVEEVSLPVIQPVTWKPPEINTCIDVAPTRTLIPPILYLELPIVTSKTFPTECDPIELVGLCALHRYSQPLCLEDDLMILMRELSGSMHRESIQKADFNIYSSLRIPLPKVGIPVPYFFPKPDAWEFGLNRLVVDVFNLRQYDMSGTWDENTADVTMRSFEKMRVNAKSIPVGVLDRLSAISLPTDAEISNVILWTPQPKKDYLPTSKSRPPYTLSAVTRASVADGLTALEATSRKDAALPTKFVDDRKPAADKSIPKTAMRSAAAAPPEDEAIYVGDSDASGGAADSQVKSVALSAEVPVAPMRNPDERGRHSSLELAEEPKPFSASRALAEFMALRGRKPWPESMPRQPEMRPVSSMKDGPQADMMPPPAKDPSKRSTTALRPIITHLYPKPTIPFAELTVVANIDVMRRQSLINLLESTYGFSFIERAFSIHPSPALGDATFIAKSFTCILLYPVTLVSQLISSPPPNAPFQIELYFTLLKLTLKYRVVWLLLEGSMQRVTPPISRALFGLAGMVKNINANLGATIRYKWVGDIESDVAWMIRWVADDAVKNLELVLSREPDEREVFLSIVFPISLFLCPALDPQRIVMVAVSSSSSGKKESVSARFLGSASSGILELLGFHPVDTLAKRLMNSKKKPFANGQTIAEGMSTLNVVIFKDAANKGTLSKYLSLFPGLGFAAGYKVLQRVYKFGGQPFVNDYLNKNHKGSFKSAFGDRHAKTMMHATAGSLIGIGEIVLLPLDALKIKAQIQPDLFKGKGFGTIVYEEGWGLYRGATWTAARNAPGSFALFGGSAIVKEHVFKLEDYGKATFFQNFCASIAGAIASITISAPLDVIKTRIQAKTNANAESGLTIVAKMMREEGFGSFFKGLTPKILVVGPKLIFSFTVAQSLIPFFSNIIDKP